MRGHTFASASIAALLSLFLAACSGGAQIGGNSSSGGTSGGTSGGAATCASLSLISSTAQLPSAASQTANGITLTASCTDKNSNLLPGVTVSFKTSPSGSGALDVTQGTTDNAGRAIAVLTTNGQPINRTITVTASSGSASVSLPITELGTSIQISGVNVVGFGTTTSFTVKLADSSGNGINNQPVSLTSALGNTITPASQNTDGNGQATFSYKGVNGGNDVLTATSNANNATGSYAVAVSNSSLTFSLPTASATTIPFLTPTTLQVNYVFNGVPTSGATVVFSTTRGVISGGNVTATSSTTDTNGNATVTLESLGTDGAGGATVSASIAGGPSATLPVQFVSNTPTQISIQATPSTIAPSATSTVVATVRDNSDNLVQGQTVSFTLIDPTGGAISAQSGVSDQSGNVTVTYKATTSTSATNGVLVSASFTANGTTHTTPHPAAITVAGVALSITLGTSNVVSPATDTTDELPYSVIVADSAGNPVPTATFSLQIHSTAYQKGHFAFSTADSQWEQVASSLIPRSDKDYNKTDMFPFGCRNEDVNLNGVLDTGTNYTEDYNGNGKLDPGNVATVPSTVVLDPTTGAAQFFITYPKDRAYWVEVELIGIADVAGTESTQAVEFVLPGVSTDYTNKNVAPPGAISPYGDIASIDGLPGGNTCQAPN